MLKLENVSFNVDVNGSDLGIIDSVSLEVPDGSFTVATGPNGGGKSTLARLIMGIEKPSSGKIIYNGKDVTNLSTTERARLGIGYAFQQPPRFKGVSVRKLLSLAAGSELPEDECCGYLSSVGLCSKDYLNRDMDASLSGGEAKRIEIAVLMARKLGLAVFDEPEAGIDLWSFSTLVKNFKEMSGGRHKSVIVISHQERIMQLADTIIVIAGGKVRESGPKEKVLPAIIDELGEICRFKGREIK